MVWKCGSELNANGKFKAIKMSRKFSVLKLPIYRDYFQIYLEIIEKLEVKKDTSKHRILILKNKK